MKFIVDKQKFHKAISTVESIISAREIRSVISNILIEAEGNSVILTATDLEMGIKTRVEAQIEVPGKITLPAKKMSQTVREFRGNSILFESDDTDRIIIQDSEKISKAKFTLMGTPSDEYPPIESMPENTFLSFPTAVVQEMIRKTGYSIAEEDARYVFNGLYIENEGKRVAFVGTDGRRLAKIQREFPENMPFNEGIILPNKAVRELLKLLDSQQSGLVSFDSKERRVHFRVGSVDLICKLIDGQFPDYRQVIPKKLEYEIPVDRSELENALRQVSVMAAEPSRQIKISFNSSNFTITASTPDIGEAQDSISANYDGEEMIVAFNSNYLMDIIRIINNEKVIVGFSTPNAPAVLKDPEDADFIAVVMPMKL